MKVMLEKRKGYDNLMGPRVPLSESGLSEGVMNVLENVDLPVGEKETIINMFYPDMPKLHQPVYVQEAARENYSV